MCVPNKTVDLQKVSKYQMKNFRNFKSLENSRTITGDEQFKDVLSVSTNYTKLFFHRLDKFFSNFQNSKVYKVLFQTTQPAHVIMIIAVAIVANLWHPKRLEVPVSNKIIKFTYFASFCTYMGSQFWMTFVSGLSLYFNLPRHHFGEVQRVLFPKYFSLNSALTFIILVIFTRTAQELSGIVLHQTIALGLSFILNLTIRLYLTPPLLKFIAIKNNIEKAVGLGMEIGTADVGPLRNCPHYIMIHQAFRRVHMSIAIGNIVAMGCTIYHLYYLSNTLCLL